MKKYSFFSNPFFVIPKHKTYENKIIKYRIVFIFPSYMAMNETSESESEWFTGDTPN